MRKIILLLILVFNFILANSQSLPCGNGRFIHPVFAATTVDSPILFGRNTTYNGVSQDLFMDIYQPAGDVAAIRPLIIFAFGGAFITGERKQLGLLCDSVARKGYVAATIDYRKYDGPGGGFALISDSLKAIDAMAKAMSDFKAAIRYFKRDAHTTNTYRIDTNSIIVGGISSGSIAALHTAYINTLDETGSPVRDIIVNNGGIDGNTDIPGSTLIGTYTFAGIRGVWNMSGALFDTGYIKAGDPALFGIHATQDPVVPYAYGRFYGLGGHAYGSSSLNTRAINVGIPNSFIPVPANNHTDFYADPAITARLDSAASNLFANILCPGVLSVSGAALQGTVVSNQVKLSWQTITENASKGFEVEKQLSTGWTRIGWVGSKSVNGYSSLPLTYNFNDDQPEKGVNLYRLKIISFNGDVAYSKTIRVSWKSNSAGMLVIYPNPAGPVLHFKTTLAGPGLYTLKIYSATMRLMQTNVISATPMAPVSHLPGGLYLAVLTNSSGQSAVNWFIKK